MLFLVVETTQSALQHISIYPFTPMEELLGANWGSVSPPRTLWHVFFDTAVPKRMRSAKKKTQTGARIHALRSTLDLAFLSCHKAAVHWKHRTDFQLHVKLLTCARFPHSPQMCSAFLCWLLILPAICLLSQTIPHMERPTRCCGV